MVLWFAVLAPILVAEVFRSPMVDYRVVAGAALLPVFDVVSGGAWLSHTLLGAVVALTLVMMATRGRRLLRRRLLGVPIGLFVHLVLDGTWAVTGLMWWPLFGFSFDEIGVPEFERPLAVGLALEALAVVAAIWARRRYELDKPENFRFFVATGQLARGAL